MIVTHSSFVSKTSTRRAGPGPVRHRVAVVVRDPRLGRPNLEYQRGTIGCCCPSTRPRPGRPSLFIDDDSSLTALAAVRDPRPGRPKPRGSRRSSSRAPSRRGAASAWRTCPTASRSLSEKKHVVEKRNTPRVPPRGVAVGVREVGCISAVSRPYLGCISAISGLYLGCISATSLLGSAVGVREVARKEDE